MEQARTTISKIFNGEPRSYTRFNLTQNMEGDTSHVEMKLSTDPDDEVGGNGVGEHHHHRQNGVHGPYAVRRPGRSHMNNLFMVSAALLIFSIGYLIGYLMHSQKPTISEPLPSAVTIPSPVEVETGAAPLMDWDEVKSLLAGQLSTAKLEQAFSDLASENHQAGTPGDSELATKVLNKFKAYGMKTWIDKHFVKVEEPQASKPNYVSFKGVPNNMSGFLAYSGKGNVTGAIIYAEHGQTEDFMKLQDLNINLTGRVVLVKAGKISFAEKVANAAKINAVAVLIYGYPEVGENTQLSGHVHLGLGDPYTPGFPSFNHTQFAPVKSSGLPSILAQTITLDLARRIMGNLGGHVPPRGWEDVRSVGDHTDIVTVVVNNVEVEKKITNVLGVIKGFVDPDHCIILGAQRDAWGSGFAKSTVGTSVLVELARAISAMVEHGGFLPRRSIVFASWSAGEYGHIGATEWLEGYLSSLSMKAFSYINLDGVVRGTDGFKASASPLLQSLAESTIKPLKSQLVEELRKADWQSIIWEPMQMEDAAFPFLTFSGIPSISFQFSGRTDYPYFGTVMDTEQRLMAATSRKLSKLALFATQVAGHMTLRLVHDHLLRFDLHRYDVVIRSSVTKINRNLRTIQLRQPTLLPKVLTPQWIESASGSFNRAASKLLSDITNSQLDNMMVCREINERIMQVERNLLSPYVSPRDSPFRHILMGSGTHTLQALIDHLEAFRLHSPDANADTFQNQLALATWTIQGCANSLVGDIWSLDNEI